MATCCDEVIELLYRTIINNGMDFLDISCKIATIIIAGANLYFVHKFHKTIKKQNMIKSLILDYSMKHFYTFFDDITTETEKLKKRNLTADSKSIINDQIIKHERDFENRFITLLLVVDEKLYKSIKTSTDKMIDKFTEAIFDEGINLYNDDQFNSRIKAPMLSTKRIILEKLLESTKK